MRMLSGMPFMGVPYSFLFETCSKRTDYAVLELCDVKGALHRISSYTCLFAKNTGWIVVLNKIHS